MPHQYIQHFSSEQLFVGVVLGRICIRPEQIHFLGLFVRSMYLFEVITNIVT